MSQANIFSTNY